MRRKIISLLFIFIILALAGCMGLKNDLNDCNNIELEQKVGCYRQVALTLAAKGDLDNAKQACGKIDTALNVNADATYFSTQRNLCYYDVATISGNEQTCGMISGDAEGSVLFGSSATESMCKEKVITANLVKSQHNTCGLAIFVFPLIIGYSFYANSTKKGLNM